MLFYVQDDDRPLFVVADDFSEAIRKWQNIVRDENDGDDPGLPRGVTSLAEDDELVVGQETVAQEKRKGAL